MNTYVNCREHYNWADFTSFPPEDDDRNTRVRWTDHNKGYLVQQARHPSRAKRSFSSILKGGKYAC